VHVLQVKQVTAYIRELFDDDPILSDVWIRGEITNFTRSSAGHIYFNLSDGEATLSCVLFRGNQRGLLAAPRAGDSVLAHGRVSIYESRGQYQLYVDNVAPEGVGILQLQFEELRRRLDSDGLFAPERKRQLPSMPSTIGVVTSPSGAVWHDIQTVISRRFPLVQLVLAPSAVQGIDAPVNLIRALRALITDGRAELIIIARGGGSAEDLACFNDEQLARAIFACPVPVVSAIGHETDVTIADLVADVRAPTPSAAAELTVPDAYVIGKAVAAQLFDARAAIDRRLADAREDLQLAQSRTARARPTRTIERSRQDIDLLLSRAAELSRLRLTLLRDLTSTLRLSAEHLNPEAVLQRGYAIVTTSNGSIRRIASSAAAAVQPALSVTFADGTVTVTPIKEA